MQAFYADHFVLPLPDGHRFPMAKYEMLRDQITAHLPSVRLQQAEPADDAALALVHDPAYIDAVRHGTLSAAQQREIGFPWSPGMNERARRSVGATVQACRVALSGEGVAATLAGGTHHAYADKGSGFCVFNDAAVAARLMQIERLRAGIDPPSRPLQVAIIDLDVHQGNGSARIFHNDPSVFTLSLHGARNFPFRKEPSDCDIDLPDGCTDAPYLAALEQGLAEVERRCEPALVIYLAGADPHEGDRLGRLRLSDAGMAARDQRVFDWAWQRQLPVAMAMAGGYGHDIQTTVRVQLNTYRIAQAAWARWQGLPAR
ncbi:histone deacetylase [Aquabacterium sp.]|uniref:histone deacetylase family protein n=1 Tax=Aquabacterium sp. TaxID=1872578 RepID=UPI0026226165|nr:histone deacetylase [Aquabacterium sp.]MDD2976276.1 histone deacetylase [Aquabacterium sp.]